MIRGELNGGQRGVDYTPFRPSGLWNPPPDPRWEKDRNYDLCVDYASLHYAPSLRGALRGRNDLLAGAYLAVKPVSFAACGKGFSSLSGLNGRSALNEGKRFPFIKR